MPAAFGAPQQGELGDEDLPDRLGELEYPAAIGIAAGVVRAMAGLREIGHPEIAEQRADVEAHRAVGGELGVDDTRVGVRHHHRAGVQVAVQQGLRAHAEPRLHLQRRELQIAIGTDRRDLAPQEPAYAGCAGSPRTDR